MTIHETSIIHPSSKIDDSVEIGPYCIIGKNVEIKGGNKLLSHVVVKGPTSIGSDNIFYQFSAIKLVLKIIPNCKNVLAIDCVSCLNKPNWKSILLAYL